MWVLWFTEACRAARNRLAEHAGLYLSHQVSVAGMTAHKLFCFLLRSRARTSHHNLTLSLLCPLCIDATTVCHVRNLGHSLLLGGLGDLRKKVVHNAYTKAGRFWVQQLLNRCPME